MNKKISIIVPIYNTEKYLEKCIKSILNQNYENIEIILINDGSTDNSLNICKKYKEQDNRIVVINKKHTGVSESRNRGLEIAKGDYIAFVDSDDYIDRRMFEKLIEGAEKYNAEISMCDINETRNSNDILGEFSAEYIQLTRKQALEQLLYDKNIGNYMTVKMFKKELFNQVKFPINKMYEDISTAYKLFGKANKLVYIPVKFYNYYQRPDSIVNNITNNSIQDYLQAIFDRYYDLKRYKELTLYNVYSIVNVVIKLGAWCIEIKDYKLFNTKICEAYYKMQKEIELINEIEIVKIMTNFEKASFYLMKLDMKYFRNFLEYRIHV